MKKMGYDYFCILTLEDTKELKIDEKFFDEEIPKFVKAWNILKEKKDNNMPSLGVMDRDLWSYGPKEELLDEVKLFTKQFPSYIFGLHCFYADGQEMLDLNITV